MSQSQCAYTIQIYKLFTARVAFRSQGQSQWIVLKSEPNQNQIHREEKEGEEVDKKALPHQEQAPNAKVSSSVKKTKNHIHRIVISIQSDFDRLALNKANCQF